MRVLLCYTKFVYKVYKQSLKLYRKGLTYMANQNSTYRAYYDKDVGRFIVPESLPEDWVSKTLPNSMPIEIKSLDSIDWYLKMYSYDSKSRRKIIGSIVLLPIVKKDKNLPPNLFYAVKGGGNLFKSSLISTVYEIENLEEVKAKYSKRSKHEVQSLEQFAMEGVKVEDLPKTVTIEDDFFDEYTITVDKSNSKTVETKEGTIKEPEQTQQNYKQQRYDKLKQDFENQQQDLAKYKEWMSELHTIIDEKDELIAELEQQEKEAPTNVLGIDMRTAENKPVGFSIPNSVKIDKEIYLKVNDEFDFEQIPDEAKYLFKHLNWYLNNLGLSKIKYVKSKEDLYYLSTVGDALINALVWDLVTSNREVKLISNNHYMQGALLRLGYPEFADVSPHLSGTFFEAIFACAFKQGNSEIIAKLKESLLGSAYTNSQKEPRVYFEEVK